ncbi:four-carbon acid sugar kinase family protein [Streptomyces sp. NPDC047070]|uniref:four-carbon acid sugar kinase family protein n=1 Tax=Streptomyces sp. NPDC047070 TaxID=3154923 RepID=UPI003455E7AD
MHTATPVPVPFEELLAGAPARRDVPAGELEAAVAASRRVVVLDDDPTGTQSIHDLPVLTAWSPDDVAWAFAQNTPGFFVLTNTRGLPPADAERVNREIATAVHEAATTTGADVVLASRGDSTLRGHFPLETDVLTQETAAAGHRVDGTLIVPALIEPGRVTVDSVHWMRTDAGMIRVGESEFARDRTFGYHSSDLRDWVAEKTEGRVPRRSVATITLADLRLGGPEGAARILGELRGAQPVVADAATNADLRVLTQGLLLAESRGHRFIYRTGPSFLRARLGQRDNPPADTADLRAAPPAPDDGRARTSRGLIVVGSHVSLTTRQLDVLRTRGHISEVELDVRRLLDATTRDGHLDQAAHRVAELLKDPAQDGDVVLRTSRALAAGRDAAHSLDIARNVSAALVDTVRSVLTSVRPAFVVAKGGITSSDTATHALGIRRAWSRGTLLPGTVAVWEPVSGPAQGIPYAVFAGNVGDDNGLYAAVTRLKEAAC